MGDCGPMEQVADTFRYSDLVVTRNENPKEKPAHDSSLHFGTCFTDHMLLVEHVEGEGWGKPAIVPFGPLSIHPAATSLHYGMGCFEGMKAYAGMEDGLGRLFRPDLNMARLQRSQQRLMLADFDAQECLECLKELLRIDRAWLPEKEGFSLYIRPLIFSSSTVLKVAPSARTTLNITLSVAGPYLSTGTKPISLFIEEQSPRAWPGGVGAHKIASNYAPTIAPQVSAREKHGAAQVVYTTPGVASRDPDDACFSECGVMNMFFLFELPGNTRELATPPLDGTILPGVTRDSILQLTAAWGEFAVTERHVTIREAKAAAAEGRLLEVFGAGTACLAQPVNVLLRADGDHIRVREDIPAAEQVVTRILREIVDIQYGRRKDHAWSVPFETAAQKKGCATA